MGRELMGEVHAKVALEGKAGDDQIRVRFTGTDLKTDAGELGVEDGAIWWREPGAKTWTHKVPVGKLTAALGAFRV
jgi:hypothetical protein